jgi:hypothetical protein
VEPGPLLHVASAMQLAPLVVGLATGSLRSAPRRWAIYWCTSLAILDFASRLVAVLGHTNLGFVNTAMPLTGAVALWTLSLWHDAPTERMALRLAIPPLVVVSVALTLWVDDPMTLSFSSAPFQALVLLLAGLWTFVRRSLNDRGRLYSYDWFWVLAGVMLETGTDMATQTVARYLYQTNRLDLTIAAFNLKAGADILAFAAIARGMLCPLPPTPSGGPSSSRSSRSRFSWAASRSP